MTLHTFNRFRSSKSHPKLIGRWHGNWRMLNCLHASKTILNCQIQLHSFNNHKGVGFVIRCRYKKLENYWCTRSFAQRNEIFIAKLCHESSINDYWKLQCINKHLRPIIKLTILMLGLTTCAYLFVPPLASFLTGDSATVLSMSPHNSHRPNILLIVLFQSFSRNNHASLVLERILPSKKI